jgi:hypothetical protein
MHRTYGSKIGVFCLSAAAAVAALLLASAPASGSTISAVGTAEQVTGGVYGGWYKYSYTLTWDLSKGLSHVDMVIPPCAAQFKQFGFDTEIGGANDGLSTGSSYHTGDPLNFVIPFEGAYEPRGDPSISLDSPIIKWEPMNGEDLGKVGVGEFSFYSNAIPYTGTFENAFYAKFGRNEIAGNLTGPVPVCQNPVPEPATMAYLLVGAGLTWLARRRNRRAARSKVLAR